MEGKGSEEWEVVVGSSILEETGKPSSLLGCVYSFPIVFPDGGVWLGGGEPGSFAPHWNDQVTGVCSPH